MAILLFIIYLNIFLRSSTSSEIESDSTFQLKFDQTDEIVSVVVGKRAILPCFITLSEGNFHRTSSLKVIWMKMNSSSVLTMENRAINTDPRISLLRAYADDWSLQIDDIDEDDAGIYRCFVNNGMFKSVTLDVKVPPKIIDDLTTEAYPSAIESGSNLTIKCYAQGKPQPTIRIISYDQFDNAKVISEENQITLINVSRQTNRRYECIASNGYPPDVARSFQFTIHYRPEVTLFINEQIVADQQQIEKSSDPIRLKCQIQMNPIEKFFWLKNQRPINEQFQTYQIENFVISEFSIRPLEDEDLGVFTCMASNSLGTNSKSIRFFTSSTTKVLNRHRKRPKYIRSSTSISHVSHSRIINVSSSGNRLSLVHCLVFFIAVRCFQ